jgi:uncharacterized membrane protein
MDDVTLARVLHVCAVAAWVGSLWFVALALLPAIKASRPTGERMAHFRPLTRGQVFQSQLWIVLMGLSGLWMMWRGDMWERLADGRFWWMHLMIGVWVVFALILFVLEPMSRKRPRPEGDPEVAFAGEVRRHRVLSLVALVTLVASLAGSHGLF